MSAEELRTLFEVRNSALSNMALFYTILAVILSGVAAFFGAYLAEKAKNTATKEDIEAITRKIERTKAEYSQKLEELKGTYQLHSVSAMRRMDALQGAYVTWAALIRSVYKPEFQEQFRIASKWLLENCIFLSPMVRDALDDALSAALVHKEMAESRSSKTEIEVNWAKIRKAGDVILAEANLPPIPKGHFPEIEDREQA